MIWISRGTEPKLNRDTGEIATGEYVGLVIGPDGQSDSGMNFDGSDYLRLPIHGDLDGDFTIQFGFKE